jgi:predicted methyltransferase
MKFLTKKEGMEYFYDDKFIFVKNDKEVFKLALYDKNFYKLRLFNGVPILEIDGLRMNLVKGFAGPLDYPKQVAKLLFQKHKTQNPKHKTENRKPKTQNTKPNSGSCLDTCMGLGYTAIAASENARSVVTCEKSEAVISLAQMNPWSADLFKNKNIEMIQGDISCQIKRFKANRFTNVIHDPPRFSKAGELYSSEFYSELLRVMKRGGMLFHYVGSVGKGKGRKIHSEVANRLKKTGFRNVKYYPRLQGIFAEK